jgi:hypothetical protein
MNPPGIPLVEAERERLVRLYREQRTQNILRHLRQKLEMAGIMGENFQPIRAVNLNAELDREFDRAITDPRVAERPQVVPNGFMELKENQPLMTDQQIIANPLV